MALQAACSTIQETDTAACVADHVRNPFCQATLQTDRRSQLAAGSTVCSRSPATLLSGSTLTLYPLCSGTTFAKKGNHGLRPALPKNFPALASGEARACETLRRPELHSPSLNSGGWMIAVGRGCTFSLIPDLRGISRGWTRILGEWGSPGAKDLSKTKLKEIYLISRAPNLGCGTSPFYLLFFPGNIACVDWCFGECAHE